MKQYLIMTVACALALGSSAALAGKAEIAPNNLATTQTMIEPDKPGKSQATAALQPVGRNVSCRKARHILRIQGFHQVKTVDCTGTYFDFSAWRLQSFYKIRVRRSDGHIVSVEPQRLKPLWDQ